MAVEKAFIFVRDARVAVYETGNTAEVGRPLYHLAKTALCLGPRIPGIELQHRGMIPGTASGCETRGKDPCAGLLFQANARRSPDGASFRIPIALAFDLFSISPQPGSSWLLCPCFSSIVRPMWGVEIRVARHWSPSTFSAYLDPEDFMMRA